MMIRVAVLFCCLALAGPLHGEDLFTATGALAGAVKSADVDFDQSRAWPNGIVAPAGVLRLEAKGNHHGWSTQPQPGPTTCHFLVVLKQPQPVGACLFDGDFELSILKPGADPDPGRDDAWQPVPYAGDPARRLRLVPLPPGTVTRAIRLSGPGRIDATGRYSRSLAVCALLRERLANLAPAAHLLVSSSQPLQGGFKPDPRRSDPETLLDGKVLPANWSSAPRKEPVADGAPEWILLDWQAPRELRAIALMIGTHESGAGDVLVQRLVDPTADPDPLADRQWETVAELHPHRPWRPPTCWETVADFGETVTTRALRIVLPAGMPKEQAEGGESANPNAIMLGEVMALQALGDQAPPVVRRPPPPPAGIVPITFTLPEAGVATIRIVDTQGRTVRNLVSGESFTAGEHTVYWDLTTIDDYWPPFPPAPHCYREPADTNRIALPGDYRWQGIWHPPLGLRYLYSYYPLKKHGLAWITADTTGGWLGDHAPPQTVVRVGDHMFVGTFCEAGHALLEADLDMRKVWGSNRIWLACPRVLAYSGGKLYYLEQGGWARKLVMIQVDPVTKQSRRLLGRDLAKDEKLDVQGLAVLGDRAYFTDRAGETLTVIDLSANLAAPAGSFGWDIAWKLRPHEQMHVIRTVPIPKPGRLRPWDDSHLAVVSGNTVQLYDTATDTLTPLVTGLSNPLGLAIGEHHRIYVGEMAPLHQVKVFDGGRLVQTIGKIGPHALGPFDMDNLESPSGIDVDAAGNVWVCEYNKQLKRTSVWDPEGHCVNQVLGPTVYGGGGDIDPRDANRMFYQGKEFRRDPATGQIRLARIVWRGGDESYDHFFAGAAHNFGGAAPAYPFYHGDTLYFTSWQGWAAGANTTLWRFRGDRLLPVAAIGTPPAWLAERFPDLAESAVFAWTDRNADGRVQRDELQAGPITLDGKPWKGVGATWQFRMNDAFVAGVSDGRYGASALAWFRPASFTPGGDPVFALPTELTPLPFPNLGHASDAVFTDQLGNAITLDEFIVSMKPDGTVNWRYKNRWPGLHRGHDTSARGDEPGVIIAPTRFFGSVSHGDPIGEIIGISSNLGCVDLITADGLYVDRVFRDSRVGLAWRMDTPPIPDVMARVSLGDEHFGGTLQQVREPDGSLHDRMVVGQPHSSVVEIDGLDTIALLPGGPLAVTGDDLAKAIELKRQQALTTLDRKLYTIPRLTNVTIDAKPDEWPKERIDGFAIGYDDANLYLWYDGPDDRAPFQNATGDNFLEAFKNGDVVDLMLATKPGLDPKRQQPAEGDIRLSFTLVKGQPAAILYDFVVPGTPDAARLPFSSPWRTITIDRVTLLPDAKIAVTRRDRSFRLEASVPLASIHLDPTKLTETRGDVGRVVSDQTGTRAVARLYWSNKTTNIMADVPAEASIHPALWGTFRFGE